jgi:ribonuclease HII
MPDLRLEKSVGGIVVGIDEVGRGPWAGPVVAAAVVIDVACLTRKLRSSIDDSKKVPAPRRVEIAAALRSCARIGVGAASVREIADRNIHFASLLAMRRAVERLEIVPDFALVDGLHLPELPCPGQAVVGGDGISLSIAAASIVAKVTRDRLMLRLSQRYPGFGWETNVGYGTPQHRDGVQRRGVTPHHRLHWAPIINILSQS